MILPHLSPYTKYIMLHGTSLLIVAIAVLLPLTPFAAYLGFVAPPPLFFPLLAAMVLIYLSAAEGAKFLFYRYLAGSTTGVRSGSPV